MSDFLDVDKALARQIVPGENKFSGYDSMMELHQKRPKARQSHEADARKRAEYARKVNEENRRKAWQEDKRRRLLAAVKAEDPAGIDQIFNEKYPKRGKE